MIASSVVIFALALSASAASLERKGTAQLVTSCTASNAVALTFDDGPYIYMTDIVNALKAAGGKGTFFVNGDNWSCIYDDAMASQVKNAYDNGFQIASHTWAHKDLSTLSREQIESEMARAEEAIIKITGAKPAFTRPPYGNYNDLVLDVAGTRSQAIVIWDFDSGDSALVAADAQKQLYDDAVGRHPNNVLSLQHEVYESSGNDVLLHAIQVFQAAGYKLVTLAECLGQEPYLSVGTSAARDETWACVKS